MNNLNIDLPALDVEQLGMDLKKLSFDLGKSNSFRAAVKTHGLSKMNVNANMKGAVNLQTLDVALGLKDLEMRGLLNADVKANGILAWLKSCFQKPMASLI
jgi:AsmA protein